MAQSTAPDGLSRSCLTAVDRAVRKSATLAFIASLGKRKSSEIWEAIKAEVAAGRLPAPCPDRVTVWRWCRARGAQTSDAESGPAAILPGELSPDARVGRDPASVLTISSARAARGTITALPVDSSRVDRLAQLRELETLVASRKAELQVRGALTTELRTSCKDELRLTRRALRSERGLPRLREWSDGALTVRLERMARLANQLTCLSTNLREHPQAKQRGSRLPVFAPAPVEVDGVTDQPTPPQNTLRGVLASTPRPLLGAVAGRSRSSKSRKDAVVRATILAPVLTGSLSCADAAAAWRRLFRGEGREDDALWLADFDPQAAEFRDYAVKYRNLHGDTLAEWQRRVKNAEHKAAAAKQPMPNPIDVLTHRKPHGVQARRKLDGPLLQEALDYFKHGGSWTATAVAHYLSDVKGVQVTERTVQRAVQRLITDKERGLARGGPAARNELFRFRLIRQAPYPNRAWIMDHSFFRAELVDSANLEWAAAARAGNLDFDLKLEAVVERHSIGQAPIRERTNKLFATAIRDACTRRVLALRIWDGAPATRTTLLALRDAMERFGRPEILYTDNGSDLKSEPVLDALHDAGILHVKSLPGCPEGRGQVENFFRVLKETILPTVPGYYGGPSGRRASEGELLDLRTLEERVWARVDRWFNNRVHEETGQKPAEHYDAMIGGRANLASVDPEAWLPLLSVRVDAVVRDTGVYALGGRYVGSGLVGIPHGARVALHMDPANEERAFVSALDSEGLRRITGVVARYGPGGVTAPEFDEWTELVREWEDERRTDVATSGANAARIHDSADLAKRANALAASSVALLTGSERSSTDPPVVAPPRSITLLPERAESLEADARPDDTYSMTPNAGPTKRGGQQTSHTSGRKPRQGATITLPWDVPNDA